MTGLRSEEQRIGDAVYRVHQLPFGQARPILWLAASVITPALEAADGVDLKGMLAGAVNPLDVEVDLGKIGKALRIFFDRASEADFARVEELFAVQTLVHVDGTKSFVRLSEIRETHWPGRYAELMAWLRFSAKVHFGPFSRGSAPVVGGLRGASTP